MIGQRSKFVAAKGGGTVVKKLAYLSAAIYFACGQASFADEFQNLQCGADIPKALIDKSSSNESIAGLEKKYRALGLKGLGGDELGDGLSSVSWLICGAEYIVLVDRRGLIRDVLPFPPHSKTSPAFSGTCRANGRNLPGTIVAILDGATATDPLPVRTAWKIDRKQAKFIPASREGIACPRSGIHTVDGGP